MNRNLTNMVLAVVLIIALAWAGYSNMQSYKPDTKGARQAIFLADGQTYFGYASSLNNPTVKLVDVYFLRPTAAATGTPTSTAVDVQKIDLIKLGLGGEDDLVGSEDEMIINRDAIKYIEVMKSDSPVNKKIEDYLNKQ